MYKYNGKELQEELGFNVTAMDYRQYDNTLGLFNPIDVMSEKFLSLSPYSFSADNPVLLNELAVKIGLYLRQHKMVIYIFP